MRRVRGFTLVELIAVIVVLGIVAVLSTQFIVSSVDSYRETQVRQKLLAKGRTSIEQMARYIRTAVPNSVRVSASGDCVEFLPTVGGAFYEGQVGDENNGAISSSLSVFPAFNLHLGSAEHAVIGALDSSEIYASVYPASRIDIATPSEPISSINFSSPHQFFRNSINSRVFIADDPARFCINSGDLLLIDDYGVSAALVDGNPGGGSSSIIASDVTADSTAFSVSSGTEDRNSALTMNLVFSQASESLAITLNQTVLIRNVP